PDALEAVVARIGRQARLRPDKTAVIAGSGSLSYAELWEQSGDLARHLVAAGVSPGEPVGLCVPRDEQMPLALLAILRSGGAYVPLDPGLPGARLAWMLRQAGITHVLAGRGLSLPDAIAGDATK